MDLEGLELCKTAALKISLIEWESELAWEQGIGEEESRLAWIRERIAETENKLEKRNVPKAEMRGLTEREKMARNCRDNELFMPQTLTAELRKLKRELDCQMNCNLFTRLLNHNHIAKLRTKISEIEDKLEKAKTALELTTEFEKLEQELEYQTDCNRITELQARISEIKAKLK